MILKGVFLFFNLFIFALGYYHYSTIDKQTEIKYDCIDTYTEPDSYQNPLSEAFTQYERPIEQIVPYCLAVETFTSNSELCTANGGVTWSFEQLEKFNITSVDLLRWNAHVNIIDEYEYYLLTHEDPWEFDRYCNCSNTFDFGRDCRYTFDLKDPSFNTILESHFSSLQWIRDNDRQTMTEASVTCYKRDALCYGACLDWRQICNGIVDCEDGQDERGCQLFEFNQCENNQYRCRSGHCIPLSFAFDMSLDCADGSDETNLFLNGVKFSVCYKKAPNVFCDESNDAWMRFPCGDGESVNSFFDMCYNRRTHLVLKHLYATDNTLCSRYMQCTQRSNFYFPVTVDYEQLCTDHDNYSAMLSAVCPESTVMFPSRPILFSPSVYLLYKTNKSDHFLVNFICYTQCDHLYPPSSKHHGHSCRSIDEFSRESLRSSGLQELIADLILLFAGCINDSESINSSLILRCPLTTKAISVHRINDGFGDCYGNFDETFQGNNCILNPNQQFQCWTQPDECIPLRLVEDGKLHCSDESDEFYDTQCTDGAEWQCDYQRGLQKSLTIHYNFEVIDHA